MESALGPMAVSSVVVRWHEPPSVLGTITVEASPDKGRTWRDVTPDRIARSDEEARLELRSHETTHLRIAFQPKRRVHMACSSGGSGGDTCANPSAPWTSHHSLLAPPLLRLARRVGLSPFGMSHSLWSHQTSRVASASSSLTSL